MFYAASRSRLFFNWIILFIDEYEWDHNNLNEQFHQVCFLFIHSSLSLSSFFLHHPLQFVFHFIWWLKVNMYMSIDKRRTDPKDYIPAVCPIHLTFDTDAWFVISYELSGTCSNTYENNYERQGKKIIVFSLRHFFSH